MSKEESKRAYDEMSTIVDEIINENDEAALKESTDGD